MKSIDIRSESAVKLIAEFLDMDAPYTPGGRHVNAEHFAHGMSCKSTPTFIFIDCSIKEVYCYVRSPYKDLFVYDSVVQACPRRFSSLKATRSRRFLLIFAV